MSPCLLRVSPLAAGLGLSLIVAATSARAQQPSIPMPSPTAPALSPGPAPMLPPGPGTASGTVGGDAAAPTPASRDPRASGLVDGMPVNRLVPEPLIPDINQRSGYLQRYTPINPHLPPDPRRDQWYDTRWGDPPNLRPHPNSYFNGGLYGLSWKEADTESYAPYFFGAPGRSTMRPESRPKSNLTRLPRSLLHPFRPVGMYYDQGSYVPVYDLDPLVPGPGAWPWPFFRRLTNWGG